MNTFQNAGNNNGKCIANQDRFSFNWEYWENITGLALGIHKRNINMFIDYLKRLYDTFQNNSIQLFPDILHLKDYLEHNIHVDFKKFLALNSQSITNALYLYKIKYPIRKNSIVPNGFPIEIGFPENWPFIEKNYKFIAELSPKKNVDNNEANIFPVATSRKGIKNILNKIFPGIIEFGDKIPEVRGSGGFNPVNEIFEGEIREKYTWRNLIAVGRAWSNRGRVPKKPTEIERPKSKQQKIGNNKITSWEEIKYIEVFSILLRFHFTGSKKTEDIYPKDLSGCNRKKGIIFVPTPRWAALLKALAKEQITPKDRFNINESFQKRFGLDESVFGKDKKIIFKAIFNKTDSYKKEQKRNFDENLDEYRDTWNESHPDSDKWDDEDNLNR